MMKKLLSIILIFVSFAAAGQTITYTPMNAAGYRYKYLLSDSGFNLPFGDTAIKRGDTRPGSLICNSSDSLIYRWTGARWVNIDLGGANNAVYNGTRLKSGLVTYVSGLTFHATDLSYYINNVLFYSAATDLTLAAADPTHTRYDGIYVDTLGNIAIVQGTPAANPILPVVDPNSQFLLISIEVSAGATSPNNISDTVIYKENVEWVGSSAIVGANFAYTVNPYAGTVSTRIPSFTNGQTFAYTSATTHYLGAPTYLKFFLRLGATFNTSTRLNVSLFNGITQISTNVKIIDGNYGFVRTTVGSYMFIYIDMGNFVPIGFNYAFNKLVFNLSGSNASGFQVDNINMQFGGGLHTSAGIITVNGSSNPNAIVPIVSMYSKNAGNDSTILLLSNGTRYAAIDNNTGGGGSGITKLGTGQLGLVDVNDSTYRLDTASVSVLSRQRAAATYQTLINFPYTTNKYYTGYGTFGSLYDSARLALSAGSGISYNNSTGVITATGGGGTVSDFTAGTLSPLFTTSVANSTTTPALTFAQSNANQYEILGRKAVGAGAYSFLTTDSSLIPDLHSQGYYDGRYLQTNSGWSLTGNSAIDTAINFIGTTDNKALRFKMKGQWAGIIDSASTTAGQVSFGFKAGGINSSSVSIGFKAGTALIAAGATGDNVAVGTRALFSATGIAHANTAVGSQALYSAASGASYYTAIGFQALYSGGGGAYHTAVGYRAMYTGGYGSSSTAVGANSLYSQSTAAGSNVAIGYSSLYGIGNYSGNTALGSDAGRYYTGNVSLTQSSNSIFIGYLSAALGNNQTNQTVIGYNAIGNGSNTTTLGNTSVTDTYVSGSISLGTTTPAASALLNMVSTTKGLLIPRMTTAERDAIASPAQGLHIWNTTDSASYFHDGTRWNKQLQQVAATITGSGAGTGWDLSETWNTSGTPTAFKLNVTSTASNAASLLMDLQTGGTSQFKVDKIGDVTTAGLITGGNVISAARTVKAGNSTSTAFLQNGFITDATYPQFGITTGQAGTFYSKGAYTLVNGSVEWSAFSDSTTINQTGTNTAMTRSFFAHPILTSAPDYRAFETVASSGKGFYQTHATPVNNFVGATNIGSVAVPSTSAQLEITSTTKGVLMPRMTATQGSAITKVDGLIIYVTNTDATFTALGFWGVENNIWIKL